MPQLRRATVSALCLSFLVSSLVFAAGVRVRLDSETLAGSVFPDDRFTLPDASQKTFLRVNLPKPDCAARPSDCADIDVLNTLDGFNLQPRLSIPFTGAIDPRTVNSNTVYLVSMGSTDGKGESGKIVGINQVTWDPATNTIHAESDQLLDQHTRYALVVTTGVHDAHGQRLVVAPAPGLNDGAGFIRAPLNRLSRGVVATFTTQSATATLEAIRAQLKAARPAPANFNLGPGGSSTTFPVPTITGITWNQQRSTTAALTAAPVAAFAALTAFPGVATLAFGTYQSPDYETADKFIPAVGTRTGVPAVQSTNTITFNLFLPAGARAANGWPVAIFGHGFGDSKDNSPYVVASRMAANGIATIAINVVGHGRGAASTMTVNRSDANGGPVTFPAGGRGIDQNGDTVIDTTEGSSAAPPRGIIGSRDGLRQTVIDLMQLTRLIETGGITGLDPSRIYYFGQSFGGIYGTMFIAVEPSVLFGVPNVPGGSIVEITRLSPVFRPLLSSALHFRTPALDNLPATTGFNFNEMTPLRDQEPTVNTVAGADAIQAFIDNTEWVSQAGNPVAYAPHIRKAPLDGVPAKQVIIQFAKGDQTVPNPTATAIIRAGELSDRATFFRYDLAVAASPTVLYGGAKNPHTFLTGVLTPATAGIATAAQQQIATFFNTGVTIDPDSLGLFPTSVFEMPVTMPLPEALNFVP